MIVIPIKTEIVLPGSISLLELIKNSISDISESSILAITSKVVSLCENRVIKVGDADAEQLIREESEYYLPSSFSKYGHHFTITNQTLIGAAGIDKSNSDGNYVLWPKDVQKSANEIRKELTDFFKLNRSGVIITDSTSQPSRLGASGIVLAHSGFKALHDYIGEPDLFGRPFEISRANIASGLAAAAVVTMGEGSEQTPLCLLSDLPFVEFQDSDPSDNELRSLKLSVSDDLFEPFLNNAAWEKGKKSKA